MNTNYQIIEKEGYYALLNKNSNTQTDFEFFELNPISEGYYSCCKEAEYYILDCQGEILTSCAQQHYYWYSMNRILTKRNDKYGFISITDNITIPFKYDEIRQLGGIFEDGEKLFNVRISNSWGILNLSGNERTQIKYTEPIDYKLKKIAFVTNSLSGLKGVLNSKGFEIISSIYTHIMQDSNNPKYFYAALGGCYEKQSNFFSGHLSSAKWGCFDLTGKLIIPVLYDCIINECDYLYAGWGGEYILSAKTHYSAYSGVYDLFNKDGKFLIGGFDLFNVDSDILFFHFGGSWEKIHDKYSENIYSFKHETGKWAVTDSKLDSLIRVNDEIYNISMNGKRVLSKQVKVEKPKEQTKDDTKIIEYSFETDISLSKEILFYMPVNVLEPQLSNKNVIIIGREGFYKAIFIKENITTDYFDEISAINETTIFIKKEVKCGIMVLDNMIISPKYDFLIKPICGYIIAVQKVENELYKWELINLNCIKNEPIAVYNKISKSESVNSFLCLTLSIDRRNQKMHVPGNDLRLKRFEDDALNQVFKKLIYPIAASTNKRLKIEWFPHIDIADEEYESRSDYYDSETPNYAEDTWYAMTDGMEGDFPEGDVDYDILGF